MPRTQLNVRVPETTLSQIEQLQRLGYESQSHTIIIAIDRLHREEFPTMTTPLTYEQKAAALFARNANDNAKTEQTTPLEWLRSMSGNVEDEAAQLEEYRIGSEILEQYTLHRFDSHQALSIAQAEENRLAAEGYETLIVERDTFGNRYTVIALRRK